LDRPCLSRVVLLAMSVSLDLLLFAALPAHLGRGCGEASACSCVASCKSLDPLQRMSMSMLCIHQSLHSWEPQAGFEGDLVLSSCQLKFIWDEAIVIQLKGCEALAAAAARIRGGMLVESSCVSQYSCSPLEFIDIHPQISPIPARSE
jgi:hypothetical protein